MNSQSEEDEQLHIPIFDKKGDIKISLDETAVKKADEVVKQAEMKCEYNKHLDPFFQADQSQSTISIFKQVQFTNYFIKHKNRDERVRVFEAMRELLLERGYTDISEIRDREEEQVMVVRVVEKVEGSINVVVVEDQHAKEKMVVREGIVWVGMICAVKVKWVDGSYKLEKIIDLSSPIPQIKAHLTAVPEASRILIVKGPFRAKFSNQDTGIRIITNQILKFRKERLSINQVIVMGPILGKNNREVENFSLTRTYQEEYEVILGSLRNQISKISPNIQIFVMPSIEDIVSLHPLPQPAYRPQNKQLKIRHLSNPSTLELSGRRSTIKMDLLNYDLLKTIETHKAMLRSGSDLRQQIFESYMKQPFILSNSMSGQDPFDEVNLGAMFNNGEFGDLLIFSSTTCPPFVNEVMGRLVVNIGGLGIDYHYTEKKYLVLLSIFEGEGPAAQRVRIDTISQG